MATFPTSKIELHQWANSILLLIVGFFVRETYNTIKADHEVIATLVTRVTVLENVKNQTSMSIYEAILPKETKVETE